MSHAAHCNHSYHRNANHSFGALCNDGYMETLEQRIKRLREERKLSQQQVADKVHVSRVAVTKWESGQTANLKLGNLLGLCELFGVSVEYLIRGDRATGTKGRDMDEKKIATVNVKIGAEIKGLEHPGIEDSPIQETVVWDAYNSADDESKAVVDFVLAPLEAPLPGWATKEMRGDICTMRYAVTRWMRGEKNEDEAKTGT